MSLPTLRPYQRPNAMALINDRSAAFIVRVWCEHGDQPARGVRDWRGSIEHVESGERAFFRELNAVPSFMDRHLRTLGIEAPNRFWEQVFDEDEPPEQRPKE